MNLRVVAFLLGRLAVFESLLVLVPFLTALLHGEKTVLALGTASVLSAVFGAALLYDGKLDKEDLSSREGIAVTGLGWLMMSILAMLPYLLSGILPPLDAYIESLSGLSGTGATVIPDLAAVPGSLLLWRAMTHWFGGLGIIVIFIAMLPQVGQSAVYMYNAESTGPMSERVLPRLKDMARALFQIYVFFTVSSAVVYYLCGMPPSVALDHAMSTMATGGYSTYDDSIAHFNNPVLEVWVIFFMLLGSGNFGLYLNVYKKGFSSLWKNSEFKAYLGILFFTMLAISTNLVWEGNFSLPEAIRYSSFQVAAVTSTTGFVSNDFDLWPSFSKFCLLLLMFMGGCAGSTAGGLKISRVVILAKLLHAMVMRKLHPQMVLDIRMNGRTVPGDVLFSVGRFFFVYIVLCVLWSLVFVADGIPTLDAIGLSISTMGSVCPGFGVVGATCTYANLPLMSKCAVCLSMFLGRLETFTVLVMFLPSFWSRKQGW